MKKIILTLYIKWQTFRDFIKIGFPVEDCCYREKEKLRRKLDNYYQDALQDLRCSNEAKTRKLLTKLHEEHQLEKQEIVKEFEQKIIELQNIIDDKEKIIKENQKAYTYIAEVLPRMQMISEQNAMIEEFEAKRANEKWQKRARIADEWDALYSMYKNKQDELKKWLGMK